MIVKTCFAMLICYFLTSLVQATTYHDSGVDIDTGDALVEHIKPLAKMTKRLGADADLGGFSGLFDIAKLGYKDPVLLATTDGVGSKVKIAQYLNQHTTIGIDLVAMSVNDLIVHGAEPVFFLDYFATSHLEIEQARAVIQGIAHACKESNCALIGGETAEMPGLYHPHEYDLAGFAVGVVERDQMLPKLADIKPGDCIIGIASSGIHSNGYSLVRHIIEKNKISLEDKPPFATHHATIGQALLEPTILYVKSLLPLVKEQKIKALAHITGGGLTENIPRILPENLCAHLDMQCWPIPALFHWLAHLGSIEPAEMVRTFNCGIGMVAIVESEMIDDVIAHLQSVGQKAYVIGSVESKQEQAQVIIKNIVALK